MFKGKNILYIGNIYHGYYKNIIKSLKNAGANIDFFPNKPKLNITYLKKISIKFNNYYIKKYFKSIIRLTSKNRYDYILFMNGEDIHGDLVKDLKTNHNSSIFLMYQWDTVATNQYLSYVNYFDSIYSFDRNDCKTYGFKYLPLFYLDEFSNIQSNYYNIDLLFIGTEHNDRLKICKDIDKMIDNYNLKFYHYIYVPFLVWWKKYLKDKKYRLQDLKYLHFNKLDIVTVLNYFKYSNVILDIHNENQSGLTMRTMEALGAKKKILTTNINIKYEEFYDPSIIQILDRNNLLIDKNFLIDSCSYPKSLVDIMQKYKLNNWIKELFKL